MSIVRIIHILNVIESKGEGVVNILRDQLFIATLVSYVTVRVVNAICCSARGHWNRIETR